ncbi:hypothetical protein ACHAXT_011423 [Thalassiosira profunda]
MASFVTPELTAFFGSRAASDADDEELLGQFFPASQRGDTSALVGCTLQIKRNDPELTTATVQIFSFQRSRALQAKALRRIGIILRANTKLEKLSLIGNGSQRPHEMWLCIGLAQNQCLRELSMLDIRLEGDKLNVLAPFIAENPRLQKLTLRRCFLVSGGMRVLSDCLQHRSLDTIEELRVNENLLGDEDLEMLVGALKGNARQLKRLNVSANAITGTCTESLATLLRDEDSNLEELDVSTNGIRVDHALSLLNATAGNKKLRTLNLRRCGWITEDHWTTLLRRALQIVCDNTSIATVQNSNHILASLSLPYNSQRLDLLEDLLAPDPFNDRGDEEGQHHSLFRRTLGEEGAVLLRYAFGMNNITRGTVKFKTKFKCLMLHMRGDINLADTTIPDAKMPRIIEWCGQNAPNPKIHMGSIYSILRRRPGSLIPGGDLRPTGGEQTEGEPTGGVV